MDMLEQESSDLADRLIQDQVTRAEEEEKCFVMQEELSAARLAEQKAVKRMKEADHRMRKMEHDFEEHKSEALKSKKEHEHLLEAKNKDIKNLQEKILKMKNDNLDGQPVEKTEEDKPLDDRQVTVTTSEDEVEEWKKLSEETKKDLQELRIKIRDLKNIWRSHLQRSGHEELKQTTSAPKKLFNSLLEGTSEVGRLEEELISSRLREVETLAEMKEWKMKTMEMETHAKTSRNQLTRQDDIVLRLQEELDGFKRKSTDLKSHLRESQIKFSNLEGKLKDEQLMGRIKDAENTQNVAELRHIISSLELKNQEMTALGNLNWCLDDNEDTKELQERIEQLTVEVNRLMTVSSSCDCSSEDNLDLQSPSSVSSSSLSSSSLTTSSTTPSPNLIQNRSNIIM